MFFEHVNTLHMKVTKQTRTTIRRVAKLLRKMYHENAILLYSTYKFDYNVNMISHSLPFNYESISNDSIANVIIRHINYKNYAYLDEMKHYMELYNFIGIQIAKRAIEMDIEAIDIQKFSQIIEEIYTIIQEEIDKYKLPYLEDYNEHFMRAVYNSIVSSVDYDPDLYDAFCSTMKYIGSDGYFAMEFSMIETDNDIVEHIPGYAFYINGIDPHYITDLNTMEIHIDYPVVALINDHFDSAESLAKIMQWSIDTEIPVVLIAKSFSYVVEEMIKINFDKNKTKVYPIVFIHDNSIELFEDMAVLTGSRVLSKETGWNGHLNLMDLGRCDKIMIMRKSCILYPSLNRMNNILERVHAIKSYLEHIKNKEKDKEIILRLRERIAKLQGRVAIVSVGGHGRYNREYRRDIFRRLVSKIQDVMQSGWLPNEKIIVTAVIEKLNTEKQKYPKMELEYTMIDIISSVLDEEIQYSKNKNAFQKLLRSFVKGTDKYLNKQTGPQFIHKYGIESYGRFSDTLKLAIDAGLLWLTVAETIKEDEKQLR